MLVCVALVQTCLTWRTPASAGDSRLASLLLGTKVCPGWAVLRLPYEVIRPTPSRRRRWLPETQESMGCPLLSFPEFSNHTSCPNDSRPFPGLRFPPRVCGWWDQAGAVEGWVCQPPDHPILPRSQVPPLQLCRREEETLVLGVQEIIPTPSATSWRGSEPLHWVVCWCWGVGGCIRVPSRQYRWQS